MPPESRSHLHQSTRQPSVQALALAFLDDEERAEILERGRIEDTTSHRSSCGPLLPNVELRPNGLEVEQFTAAAWATQVTWHAYWRLHGYMSRDPAVKAGAPDEPRNDHHRVQVPWRLLREWLAETTPAPTAGEQLDLFGVAA